LKNFFQNAKKGKGQGVIEYALILVLVAIVVIAALMILGPIMNSVLRVHNEMPTPVVISTSNPTLINQTALADAPFIKEGLNTIYSVPLRPETYLFTWYRPGCTPLVSPPDGFGLKVGTISENFAQITVLRQDNEYTLCNNVQGDQVAIITTFVERPQ
jgi:pilus assembly protein Flp/PilA